MTVSQWIMTAVCSGAIPFASMILIGIYEFSKRFDRK